MQPLGILTKFCVFIILPFLDLLVYIFILATRKLRSDQYSVAVVFQI